MSIPRHRTFAGLVALATLVVGACEAEPSAPRVELLPPPARPTLPPTYRPSGHAAAGDVFVHLFAWRWLDVAQECEGRLGPAGYRAVQVSPPQEHVVLTGFPWWQRYQPVSYSLGRSRSGSEAEFVEMVARCAAAGVDVYADAVINHMTAGAGTGSNGTEYTKYLYPGLFDAGDFHPPCTVSDYQSAANVQDCELLGLADLHTGDAGVRMRIAEYLTGLVQRGVAGFRLDAAKHVQPVELDSVLAQVNRAAEQQSLLPPYVFAEVIDHGTEAVAAADYFGLGYRSGGAADVTEFRFRGFGASFTGSGGSTLADLRPFAEGTGLMPSDKAVVFLENHDTQRDAAGLGYRDGQTYRLANVWMLAQPYGYPKVMSSYSFDLGRPGGRDAGPPSDASGQTRPVQCPATLEEAGTDGWVCEHRDPAIRAMVAFRRIVAGAALEGWWDNGADAVAFSRGERGFVALSREAGPVSIVATTRLPPGSYCDALAGGLEGSGCAGRAIVVDEGGGLTVELGADDAVAIHVGTRR